MGWMEMGTSGLHCAEESAEAVRCLLSAGLCWVIGLRLLSLHLVFIVLVSAAAAAAAVSLSLLL